MSKPDNLNGRGLFRCGSALGSEVLEDSFPFFQVGTSIILLRILPQYTSRPFLLSDEFPLYLSMD